MNGKSADNALTHTYPTLSLLPQAGPGCLTYYEGDDTTVIAGLSGCGIFCKPSLKLPKPCQFEPIIVEDPRLEFFRISAEYKNDDDGVDGLKYRTESGVYIGKGTELGNDVSIGPGSVVRAYKIGNNVKIGSNVVVHSNVEIEDDVIVESSTVIGATGVVWMWAGDEKVYMEQTGRVIIRKGTFIGSNISIVRGGPNMTTHIGKHCCIAHGSMIGHDCQIGDLVHIANNVALAGSVYIGTACFIGSGASVVPGTYMGCEVILGAGAVLTKAAESYGVYHGNPAKWVKSSKGKLTGVPRWKR